MCSDSWEEQRVAPTCAGSCYLLSSALCSVGYLGHQSLASSVYESPGTLLEVLGGLTQGLSSSL